MEINENQNSPAVDGQASAKLRSGLKVVADDVLRRGAEARDVPGVVAAVTDRKETIYEAAFGQRILGQEPKMTSDTVVWIASMTKAITAAAAMQLVEQGGLDLDSPAADVVPEISGAQVLIGFDSAGTPQTRSPRRAITLRHLLTHTAGFGYEMWNGDLVRYNKVSGVPFINTCENAALRMPLLFDPGERWEYGISVDWAGKMVEAVSHKKLRAYVRENLLEPLGMSSTGFEITSHMRGRLAKMHERRDDDSLEPLVDWEFPQKPEFDMGGGGLYSTVGDYLRFVRMILNRGESNGNQVLKSATVDLMSSNNIGDKHVSSLRSFMPSLSNDVEFFPGIPKKWGISFQINSEQTDTGLPAGSLMWAGLSNCYFWIDRSNGIGGVYATQILPFGDKKSLPIFYDFQSSVYSLI